jgi:acetyltransferase-like isoleucine patch superfamily enzyme
MNYKIPKSSKIKVRKANYGKGVEIGEKTTIEAGELILGDGIKIGDDCHIKCKILHMGDFTTMGPHNRIDAPIVKIGDYGVIYDYCLFYGKKEINIGHNFYLGGHSILNSYAPLTIGNGVGIGTYSQVWTHAIWGEEIEGCVLNTIKETVIEDGAWLVGHTIISLGVKIGKYAIILPAAMLTKNAPPKSVWGGCPAKNISDKIAGYKEMSIRKKFILMKSYCIQFAEKDPDVRLTESENFLSLKQGKEIIRIYESTKNMNKNAEKTSTFDISSKRYSKTKTKLETKFMRFLKDYRARFYPI